MSSILFRSAALCAAVALVGASDRAVQAQAVPAEPVLYGLSEVGNVAANGLTIDTLGTSGGYVFATADDFWEVLFPGALYLSPTGFVQAGTPTNLWSSLAAEGTDRYAMRRDGRLRLNDAALPALPWDGESLWIDLAVRDQATYALRSDGALAVDGVIEVTFPAAGFLFRRVINDGVHTYSLRSDGVVFRDLEPTPYFNFRGGAGDQGRSDGQSAPTTWIALARDPSAAFVYALRADGVVLRGSLSIPGPLPLAGEVVATLPYDGLVAPLLGQLYNDLEFVAGGTWIAVTGNGVARGPTDPLVPLADLPGDALDANTVFVDLTSDDGHWFALRSDGKVFCDGRSAHCANLEGAGYGSLAVGHGVPALTVATEAPPKATVLVTKSVVGTPLSVPVLVADADTPLASIVVTTTGTLPPGSTFDAGTNTLTWSAPGPAGSYPFDFDVSDGVTTKSFSHTIKVRDPDSRAANTAPLVPVVQKAVATVGLPFVLPIVVDDRDADPLTVTVNTEAYPFTAGATYDDVTRVFSWTPGFGDQGTVQVKFKVKDGKSKSIFTLSLKVRPSLFPPPPPPPPPLAKPR